MSYSVLNITKSYALKEVKLNIEGRSDFYGIQVGDNVILNGTTIIPNTKIQGVYDKTTDKYICYNLVPNSIVTEYREPDFINVESEPIVVSEPKEVEQPKVEKKKSETTKN